MNNRCSNFVIPLDEVKLLLFLLDLKRTQLFYGAFYFQKVKEQLISSSRLATLRNGSKSKKRFCAYINRFITDSKIKKKIN